jgi:hypothetical protein
VAAALPQPALSPDLTVNTLGPRVELLSGLLKAIASPLSQAIAEGKSLEQVQAMRLADGWKQERVFFSADDFIAMAYRGYSSSKSSN